MSSRPAALALVLALLVAAGCSGAPLRPSAHRSASDPSSPAATRSPSHAASPSRTPSPSSSSSAPYQPTAPADTPLGAGERVWAAFSQRGLSHDKWWAQLEPLLSASARAVYVYDDPRNIPAMQLEGKIHLAPKAPDQPRFTAEVVVPTSKGVFALDLERHTLKSPWLLYAIKFPHGVQ